MRKRSCGSALPVALTFAKKLVFRRSTIFVIELLTTANPPKISDFHVHKRWIHLLGHKIAEIKSRDAVHNRDMFDLRSAEMVLTPIDEDEDSLMDEGVTEKDVAASKLKTEFLAAEAANEMEELAGLLGKVKTSTATADEKRELLSAKRKLDKLKSELKKSKASEADMEMSYLRSCTARSLADVRTRIKEKDIRSVVRALSAAESVDLCFIVDCTGSMCPHIEAVKSSIRDIIFRVRATNANLNLRLAFVAYRGVEDDKAGSELLDFVPSVEKFLDFMAPIRARNGESLYGENMAGGIQCANGLSWEQPTRVCFIIADMSCHGDEFLSGTAYPGGTPGINIVDELKTLEANSNAEGTMTLNFGRITSTTDRMSARFKDHFGIQIAVVDIKDTSKMTACVTTGLRKSIFKTMTVAGGIKSVSFAPVIDPLDPSTKASAFSKKSYKIEPKRPSSHEWKIQPAVKVKLFRNKGIKHMRDLRETTRIWAFELPYSRAEENGPHQELNDAYASSSSSVC